MAVVQDPKAAWMTRVLAARDVLDRLTNECGGRTRPGLGRQLVFVEVMLRGQRVEQVSRSADADLLNHPLRGVGHFIPSRD
jgi:hypothetical protein